MSLRAGETSGELVGMADREWLLQWQNELSAFITGFSLPPTPITIDTQSTTGSGILAGELEQLLQDERSEMDWRDARDREQGEQEDYENMLSYVSGSSSFYGRKLNAIDSGKETR